MAANKTINIQPVAIPVAVGNLLNCAITSLSGPVGLSLTQPYLIINHMRIINYSGSAISVTLYKGASGGSAAGTQILGGVSIPANSYIDVYGKLRLDSTDFLTGVASAANAAVLQAEGEVGFA